jgi:tRNA C32,U32 (ribose-2'-O)-methylase TrmJ
MSKNKKFLEEKAATLSSKQRSVLRTTKLYPKLFWKVAYCHLLLFTSQKMEAKYD